MSLETLLNIAEIKGGWWLTKSDEDDNEVISNPEALREMLKKLVSLPPYRFWGPLVTDSGQDCILIINNQRLWLPDEIWKVAVGGSLNRLSSDLMITIQEWPQSDGGMIVLFYVVLRETDRAIAIRRFQQHETIHATLNVAYQLRRTKALEVAQILSDNLTGSDVVKMRYVAAVLVIIIILGSIPAYPDSTTAQQGVSLHDVNRFPLPASTS